MNCVHHPEAEAYYYTRVGETLIWVLCMECVETLIGMGGDEKEFVALRYKDQPGKDWDGNDPVAGT